MSNPAASDPNQRYTTEEAGELVRLATSIEHMRQDGLSYDEFVGVAEELGVSEESLRAAMEQAEREQAERERVQAPVQSSTSLRTVADRCLEILCLKPIDR